MPHSRLPDGYYTAAGVLGAERSTMFDNYLTLREGLGKTHSVGYFVNKHRNFGKQFPPREPDTGKFLRWHVMCANDPALKATWSRDFVGLNRVAVESGLVTSRQHSQFRRTHDIRISPFSLQRRTRSRTPGRALTMVHGLAGRPSTPIGEVISHHYQDQWIANMQHQLGHRKTATQQLVVPGKMLDTRGSVLRPAATFEGDADTGTGTGTDTVEEKLIDLKTGRGLDTFRHDLARTRAIKSAYATLQ